MNLNIYGAYNNIKKDMKKDGVSKDTLNEFEFVMEQIIEFCEELKTRRKEGIKVIDEFTTVLCIKD